MSPQRINLAVCRDCPDCQAQPKNGGCNGPCACMINGLDIHELADKNECPTGKFPRTVFGRFVVQMRVRTEKKEPQSGISIEGPKLWAKIHRWAMYGDIDRPLLFISEIIGMLGQSICAGDSRRWILENPPDVTSRETLFAWTVRWHNHVNVRLGKPEMTVEAARIRWIQ